MTSKTSNSSQRKANEILITDEDAFVRAPDADSSMEMFNHTPLHETGPKKSQFAYSTEMLTAAGGDGNKMGGSAE